PVRQRLLPSFPTRRSSDLQLAMFGEAHGYNLTGTDEPVRANGFAVTANLFQTLGVNPAIGRNFSIEEETQGHDHVAILSHGLWRSEEHTSELQSRVDLVCR